MDLTCAICLENMITISNKCTFNCEHSFHKNCIDNYLDTSCPLCKIEFVKSNIYYVHNINNFHFKNIVLNNNKLNNHLNKYFKLNERSLFLKLLNPNVLLTGSTVLSVILNQEFENQNLDLIIDKYSDYKLIKKFLLDCNYIKSNNTILSDFHNNKIINKNVSFTKNSKIIYIIFNQNNIFLIKYYFDLDILKNYYDGIYFYIYDKTKLELQIDYIEKSKLTKNVKNRIIKYRNRGIKIYITDN